MKKLKQLTWYIILCSISTSIIAQESKESYISIPYDTATEDYYYERNETISEKSANDIYKKTKSFLIELNSSNQFFIDEQNIKLAQKGSFTARMQLTGSYFSIHTILYTISLKFNSNGYCLVLNNFKISSNAIGTMPEVSIKDFFDYMENTGMKKKNKNMIKSLAESINTQSNKIMDEIYKTLSD